MKSPEGLAPAKTEIEKAEQEIAPKSPEIEVAEISNEEVEQHAISAESQIEQQTAEILPEGEKRMGSSVSSMNVSPETLDSTKQEFGLDAKLQEVQAEADQIASEAKSEIASVAEKPQPEKVAEVKEKTPEEIKEERRMGIVKELEKEWETKNGPMDRSLSEREIEKNKEMARLWGKEWDGRTTQLTEAASEYFFDHRGMGKNSVPGRADKILAERYPEYAEKTKEEQKQNSPEKTQQSWPSSEAQKPTQKIENRPTGKLSEVFEKAGLESRVVKIENGGEFSEAIIFDKKEASPEKMARLYRGINHLDASVLEQIPYAMRTENGTGKPTTLESVRQEVDTLAKNPTYENLLAYTDKVRQHLSPDEARRFDEDFARIEDGILDGNSTRKELIFKQIEHGGGWGESGISPYISTSFDPYEAAGYGNEGLIIMDVPLSQIEDFRADATEANIKGALDKKYITAILPRKREGTKEKEELNQEIYQALQKVYESAPANLYGDEELRVERERKLTVETESDKEQWNKDVEAVRQKRVAKLTRRFPEVKLDLQSSPEQGADIYTKAKRDIFDFYKSRLEKIGRNGRNIEDYEYQEKEYGEQKKFDREKANDIMLLKLKALVERLEEKEEERNRR